MRQGAPDQTSTNTSGRDDVPAPYRGLGGYRCEDGPWFFGRDDLVEALISRIGACARRLAIGTGRGLVVVVGACGSGKSSLLRAGLLPAVRRGVLDGRSDGETSWSALLMTPGTDPVGELHRRLDAHGRPDGDLVLVVDQFEELFTADPDPRRPAAFTAELLDLADRRSGRTVVVAGLRADLVGRATRLPGMVAALQDAQVVVGPMTAGQLRRAIVEPARAAGVALADGLVEDLLRELAPPGDGPGGWVAPPAHEPTDLPLLSHALLTAWRQGPGTTLGAAELAAAGGVRGAVARTAEAAYGGLTPAAQEAAARMFRRLVRVPSGLGDVSRPLAVRELGARAPEPGSPLHTALEAFTACDLLSREGDLVRLTHDALIPAWPRLRAWVDADLLAHGTHRRLTEDARDWNAAGRDPQALYRGARLVTAQDWVSDPERAALLSPVEQDFLNASHEQETTRARERRGRRDERTGPDGRDERSGGDGERPAGPPTGRRVPVWVAAVLVVLLAAAGTLAGSAVRLRSDALTERDRALSRQVAGESVRSRGADDAVSAQLAVLAYRTAGTPQAVGAVLDAAARPQVARVLGPGGPLGSVTTVGGGSLVAASGLQGTVRIWSRGPDGRLRRAADLSAGTGPVRTAFSPDGHTLVTAGAGPVVRLWDVSRPEHPVALGSDLTGPRGEVDALAFRPDGHLLAVGGIDRLVHLWDVTDPGHAVPVGPPLGGPAAAVRALAFSPDGRTLAAAGEDRRVRLWNLTTPARPAPYGTPAGLALVGANAWVLSLAFAPGGRTVVAGGQDGTVHTWDLTRIPRSGPRGTSPTVAPQSWPGGPTDAVTALAYSPDGHRLAASSADGSTRVWDAGTGDRIAVLTQPAAATGVAWQTPGTLMTSGDDGAVRSWDLADGPARGVGAPAGTVALGRGGLLAAGGGGSWQLWDATDRTHPVRIGSAITGDDGEELTGPGALSPDGTLLLTATVTGRPAGWDLTDPARPHRLGAPLTVSSSTLRAVAFAPDGTSAAVGGSDGRIQLVDLSTRSRPAPLGAPLDGSAAAVLGIAFGPGGTTLAAGAVDGTARLWDVRDRTAPAPLGPPLTVSAAAVLTVALSPDGRILATGTQDHTVRLWDLSRPAAPVPLGPPLTGPAGDVTSVAFSPDGRTLAAASQDRSVRLWDLHRPAEPAPVATLTDPGAPVHAVGFSPDGRTLAATGEDRLVWLWDLDPGRAADRICAAAGDPLTPAEWAQSAAGVSRRDVCPR